MTIRAILLLTTALISAPGMHAQAGSRYSTPKAVVLSPDLTSPWVLQLKRSPTPQQKAKVRVYQPKPVKKQTYRQRTTKKRHSTQGTGIFALFNTQPAQRSTHQQLRKKKTSNYASLSRPAPQASNRQAAAYIEKQAAQRPIDPRYLPRTVNFNSSQKPGTILIDTQTRYLYLIMANGKARRYGVGVGKQGFEWTGSEKITRKAEWPSWRPPKEMIARERKKGRELPEYMAGGPANPLGARALYLGSTLYRIHGTNQPWTIGQAVSSGCIRMRNEDVMDLYERTRVGAKVIVS